MIREILKLGDPQLYEVSEPVTAGDLPLVGGWVEDLHDTLMEYRRVYGARWQHPRSASANGCCICIRTSPMCSSTL